MLSVKCLLWTLAALCIQLKPASGGATSPEVLIKGFRFLMNSRHLPSANNLTSNDLQTNVSLNPIFNATIGINITNSRHCKLLCASDQVCHSYSFCDNEFKNYQHQYQHNHDSSTSCILSRVSLKSEEKLSAFVRFNETPDDRFRQFSLKLPLLNDELQEEEQEIRVERDANCFISSLSLNDELIFEEHKNHSKHDIKYEILVPVIDSDDCARICLERNFRTRNYYNKLVEKKMKNMIAEQTTRRKPDDYTSWLEDNERNKLRKYHCSKTIYFNLSAISEYDQLKETVKIFNNLAKSSSVYDNIEFKPTIRAQAHKTENYCAIQGDQEFYYDQLHLDHNSINLISMKTSLFQALSFYNEMSGFSLRDSPKSNEERLALSELNLPRQNFASLSDILNRFDNNQKLVRADAMECAKICLWDHTTNPSGDDHIWPICRSFDIIIDHDLKRKTSTTHCLLNTISLSDIINQNRLDLIEHQQSNDSDNETVQHRIDRYHYELYEHLVMAEEPGK